MNKPLNETGVKQREAGRDKVHDVLKRKFPDVPMDAYQDEVIECIRQNENSIIIGETGSGKSTRIPSFLLDAFPNSRIAITQPRRVAARAVSRFVAEQRGGKIGGEVGFKVRHDDETSPSTRATFMTDGILLRQLQFDPLLEQYDVVMVDEAHERNLNIDFVIGLLRKTQAARKKKGMKELKIVVTSATLEKDKFARYFNDSPIVEVPGRMHPVKIEYVNDWSEESDCLDERGRMNMSKLAAKRVQMALTEDKGDILIFMPGQHEIESTIREIEALHFSNIDILPLHGGLAPEDQDRIFQNTGKRKIIVATNIAETSLTIEGVRFVIDSGQIKQKEYNPYTGIESLDTRPHAQSGCNQRTGRAGRTAPGTCYRLYTEDEFEALNRHQKPEILRSNLSHVILTMKIMGIEDIRNFDFIDRPDQQAFSKGIEILKMLGALDDLENITELGRKMAELPLEPEMARMVIEAEKHGCVEKVCTIAAMMGDKSVFSRPKGEEYDADAAHDEFRRSGSDFLSHLEVWQQWTEANFSEKWAWRNYLNVRQLNEIRETRRQLLDELAKKDIPVKDRKGVSNEVIEKCVASGLLHHLMISDGEKSYNRVMDDTDDYFIHPSSATFRHLPHIMIGANVLETSRKFARRCQPLNGKFAVELAPHLFKEGEAVSYYDRLRGEALENVEVLFTPSVRNAIDHLLSHFEPRVRPITYFQRAPKDPKKAAKILAQVIAEQRESDLECAYYNDRVITQLQDLYHRSGGEVEGNVNLADWYAQRLVGCSTMEQVRAIDEQLILNLNDYCSAEERREIESQYPDYIDIKGVSYHVAYEMGEEHTATITIDTEDIFKLEEGDIPRLGPVTKSPKFRFVARGRYGYRTKEATDLRTLKESQNQAKLDAEWSSWATYEGRAKRLYISANETIPTAASLEETPRIYGSDYEGNEAWAYPGVKSERLYNPVKGGFSYTIYLMYFRTAEEAEKTEAETQAQAYINDSPAQIPRREVSVIVQEINARRQMLPTRIDRSDLDQDQKRSLIERLRRIEDLIYDKEFARTEDGKQHILNQIKELDRDLDEMIEELRRAKSFNPIFSNDSSGLPSALQSLIAQLPNGPRPRTPAQSIIKGTSNSSKGNAPKFSGATVAPTEVKAKPDDFAALVKSFSTASKHKPRNPETATSPPPAKPEITVQKEEMTPELRDELNKTLAIAEAFLRDIWSQGKAKEGASNISGHNRAYNAAGDRLTELNAIKSELRTGDNASSLRGKTQDMYRRAERLSNEMGRVQGKSFEWTNRYQEIILTHIPAIEKDYQGTISALDLASIRPELIRIAKTSTITDIKKAIEEMVAEKLTA